MTLLSDVLPQVAALEQSCSAAVLVALGPFTFLFVAIGAATVCVGGIALVVRAWTLAVNYRALQILGERDIGGSDA